jgi:hypothetical protein
LHYENLGICTSFALAADVRRTLLVPNWRLFHWPATHFCAEIHSGVWVSMGSPCWDQDRFGRFDSLEAGYWIHPFRQAGVRLVTVTEGPINWEDFTGRVMYSLKQEGKHQFLRDLSRNTARGQTSNAKAGFSAGSDAPYGLDRMLVDEQGVERQRVRRGEQVAKPKSWHSR